MRIVSLLPSATEIVCAIGLEKYLVGVTHECDYPPSIRSLPKVTETLIPRDASSADIDRLVRIRMVDRQALYTLDRKMLESLRPDIIVTQALCDVCAVAEEEVRQAVCALPGAPTVLNLEPQTLAQVFDSMVVVGRAAGVEKQATRFVENLRSRVLAVANRSTGISMRPRVVVLEWLDPLFSCGHWTPELVEMAGGREMIAVSGERSRIITPDDLEAAQPEVIAIACCGYSTSRTLEDIPIVASQSWWHSLDAVKKGNVFVLDGNAFFSRPGPRLVESLELLAHAIDPRIHPAPGTTDPATRLV